MRGYPRYNFDAFEKACAYLRGTGHTIVSPHEHDLEMGFNPDGKDHTVHPDQVREMIMWDLNAVAYMVDALYVLPGWEKSKGCAVEMALAKFLGKSIYYAGIDDDTIERIACEEQDFLAEVYG
jgi:hypothetical protein